MLDGFDWLRRCRTGAELLATLEYLEAAARRRSDPLEEIGRERLGPPYSALDGPCQRCWIYPRAPTSRRDLPPGGFYERRSAPYCRVCSAVMAGASRLGPVSRRAVVLWGRVNRLPRQLASGEGFRQVRVLGAYCHEAATPGASHFLVVMRRRDLKGWLQELVLYHGTTLKGLLQVLPTTGVSGGISMGDILCRAIHQEGRFGLDQLRVRFFSAPHQLLAPHTRDKRGMLTFEISDFLSLLEMAAVFRTLLRPEAQQALQQLLELTDPGEEQFYWGRFLGYLTPEAKDMLSAWRIRQWPKPRIQLLYELAGYVSFYQ